MAWNRRAHPNESSLWCLVCVCKVILYEVFAVSNAEGPLHLLKLHAKVVNAAVPNYSIIQA